MRILDRLRAFPGLFLRYWRTIRHLKPVQLSGRIRHSVYRPRPDTSRAPPLREATGEFLPPPRHSPCMKGADLFEFLNREGRLTDSGDWNDGDKSDLWLYQLHSFGDLVARDASRRSPWHESLISRWIDENPPGQGIGWDSHPTSLRMVNWIKWALDPNVPDLSPDARHSLAVQARWLRRRLEHHLLGNHLFANAKALCFAGLYLSGEEGRGWYSVGRDLVERELEEQVLGDGGHFERSPMYHAVVLEDVLDLMNVHRLYRRDPPDGSHGAAASMASWLRVMRHPDGEIPFFNDAALGEALSPAQLDSYAARLGVAASDQGESGDATRVRDLSETGYVRLQEGPVVAFLDLAPVGPDYLPAHAHADTLSFELSLDGRRLFVNSGVSTYEPGPRRSWERGTSAHNTAVFDGEDSSEVWNSFRVARRARLVERRVRSGDDSVRVTGAHDGYRRLAGRPRHRREWELGDARMEIADRLEGEGRHDVEIWFHLHPSWTVVRSPESRIVLGEREGPRKCVVRFEGPGRVQVEKSSFAPEFGRTEVTQALRYRVRDAAAPLEIRTDLRWGRNGPEGM